MEDLELFAVSASGRINLGDLLSGVKYAQAKKQDDGSILVKPVGIRPASGANKSLAEDRALPEDQPIPGTEPVSDLDDEEDGEPWKP